MSNQNDRPNENQNDELQKMEKQVQNVAKQTIKDAARIAGKAIKKVAKKAISAIVKALGWKLALIILVVVAVIVLVAGLWYVVKYSTFLEIAGFVEEDTDTTGQVSLITEIDPETRELKIDDEQLKEKIQEWFEKSGVDKNYVGIDDNLDILEEFLRAEVATLYPDLRLQDSIGTSIGEDEVQGCVQFLRHYSDGTEELLEYMSYDEYSREVAKLGVKLDDEQTQKQIYFDRNSVETQYNKLKDKFTLDKDKNLIVIGLYTSETTVTYNDFAKQEGKVDGDGNSFSFTINVERVNYQSVISKYSMPFEFGLALLMITDNPAFCEELVELAKNSKIVIGIHDNNVSTNMVTNYSVDVNHLLTRNVMYKIEERETEEDDWKETRREQYKPYPMTETITIQNNPYSTVTTKVNSTQMALCVETVDTWIASYESEYIKNNENKEETTTYKDEDDPEFVEIKDIYSYNETKLPFTLPKFTTKNALGIEVEDKNKRAVTIENKFLVREKRTNKNTTTTVKTNTVEYTKSTSTVKETPEKFLSLFKVNPDTGVYDLENRNNNTEVIKYKNGSEESSPINNLFSAKQMLFEFLLSTSKTIELKNTMEYLLDLYEGNVTLDESRNPIYEPGEFIKVGRYSNIEQFKQYLHKWEGCTSLSPDGTKYRIEVDGGGNLTVGYGIDIAANKRILESAGYSTNEGDYIDKQFVDTLENEIINANIKKVQSATSGLNLTQYQIYALVSRMYNCGEGGALGVRNNKTFVQAYNAYWDSDKDLEYKVPVNESMYNHQLYKNYMNVPITSNGVELPGLIARRKSEWILFKTGYYDRLGEYCLDGNGASAILEAAEYVHSYMEKNNYRYCLLGNEKEKHSGRCGLNETFEESKTKYKLTCCATYVSWVLREAGLTDKTYHGALSLGDYLLSVGFYAVDYSKIEAGDIVIMVREGGGHTQIYAGDGQWYNAGSNNAIQKAAPYTSSINQSNLKYVLRAP